MSIYSSKKGISASLMAIVGLILAAIIIIPFSVFSGGILDILTGGPGDQSIRLFSEVLGSVEVLIESDKSWCYIPDVKPEEDFVIAGFNKKGLVSLTEDDLSNGIEEHCGAIEDDLDKPSSCGDSACICLCKIGWGDATGDDCEGDYCNIVRDVDRFALNNEDEIIDMVIYGKSCVLGREFKVPRTIILTEEKKGSELRIVATVLDETESSLVKKSESKKFKDIKPCRDLGKEETKTEETKENSEPKNNAQTA